MQNDGGTTVCDGPSPCATTRARARGGSSRARRSEILCFGGGGSHLDFAWVSVDTTHCSSSRATRAYARDLALGSWVDSGFGRLVALPVRVSVDENLRLTDVNVVLSAGE